MQDFLNTRALSETGIDLLGNTSGANEWAAKAVRAWNARRGSATRPPTMSTHDAAELRSMRDHLVNLLAGRGPATDVRPATDAILVTTRTGDVHWAPAGHGWRWLDAAISGEVLLSQQNGTWRRLKQCENTDCRATMYDSTWDNRAVWHDRSTCDPSFGRPYPFHS
ncbi:CGNR zinc finger domain-containing protein [Mycolicibacterium sediminis]|uniref:CGNR zinc finger domain-containing protein n=1 Tax=Mycolicibacterium sediminis TaxID=1286180 RepID=UPI0013D41379|nr:CGNR zinc finger domain-containing protein [Mycolicibacterium sediminis]